MKLQKHHKVNLSWVLLIINLVIWYNLYQVVVPIGQAFMASPIKTIHIIKQAKASELLPSLEPTEMREWVRWYATTNGVDANELSCLIKSESGWNQYAINKNTNGTYDTGLLQINEIHRLPRECTFDFKCATRWAVKKIKHDGNMMAWYGWRAICK